MKQPITLEEEMLIFEDKKTRLRFDKYFQKMRSGLKLQVGTSRVLQEISSTELQREKNPELQREKNPKFPADVRLLSDKHSLITAMHRDAVSNKLNVSHLHNKCYILLPLFNHFHDHLNTRSLQVTKIIIMQISWLPVQNSSVIPDVFLSPFSNHSYFQRELHRMRIFQSSMTMTAPQNVLKNRD